MDKSRQIVNLEIVILFYTTMKNILLILTILAFSSITTSSQTIERVDPPNWWTGMKYNNIELLVKGKDLRNATFSTIEKDITIEDVIYPENPDYVYLDISISSDATSGIKVIDYKIGRKTYALRYEIKQRIKADNIHQGISSADVMYLITPDRFANGDARNDVIEEMKDKAFDRKDDNARHGGDLRGIINKLDYIKSLGMTATWLTPIEENDMDATSYHGYAFTDHFKVDSRFGTNEEYLEYVEQSHNKGLKVVKDVVYNHFGINHYLIKNLPSKSWVHYYKDFTRTNYRASTLMDPHASVADKKLMLDGWFDTTMPDMNQSNKHVASFLIQNSLWWIESFGIDAYRVDTYPYSDQKFMSDITKAVYEEYPEFKIFGETWVVGTVAQAWFTDGFPKEKYFTSFMEGVTDFAVKDAILASVQENFGWNTGVSKLYYTLTRDYIYKEPDANVIFFENHDTDRFLGVINGNLRDYKMAMGILFTMRGIPQIYYGSEINMAQGKPDGHLRADFPGGWKEDKQDKFTEKGRSQKENDTWNYISTLANWRLKSSAVKSGKLIQFAPEGNIYVYFRYDNQQTVMIVVNTGKDDINLDINRFKEITGDFTKAKNIITDKIDSIDKLKIEGRTTSIFELM